MPPRSFRVGRALTGLCLVATKPIKRLAYIVNSRGRRPPYRFDINSRWTTDGSPRWNLARYFNHACRPNAKPVGRNGGIVFVALRRIEPGEEITIDYGKEYLDYFMQSGGCRCDTCRRKRAAKRRKQRRAARQRN